MIIYTDGLHTPFDPVPFPAESTAFDHDSFYTDFVRQITIKSCNNGNTSWIVGTVAIISLVSREGNSILISSSIRSLTRPSSPPPLSPSVTGRGGAWTPRGWLEEFDKACNRDVFRMNTPRNNQPHEYSDLCTFRLIFRCVKSGKRPDKYRFVYIRSFVLSLSFPTEI